MEEGKDRRGVTYQAYDIPECIHVVQEAQAKYEYRSGGMHDMAGGSPNHALITMNFAAELHAALRKGQKPCRVYSSDLMLHSWQDDALLFPDVTVICGAPEASTVSNMAVVNPTLVVEVTSPSTEDRDRGEKFEIYKRFPSLQEYILVSQEYQFIEHYWLDSSGKWRWREVRVGMGPIRILSLGLRLDWEAVYAGAENVYSFGVYDDV